MRTGDEPEAMLSFPVPVRSTKGGAASALSRCMSMKRRPDRTDSQSSRLTRMRTPTRAMMSGISYSSPVEAAFVAHARHEPGTPQVIVHQATSAEADDQVNTCQHEDDENEDPAQYHCFGQEEDEARGDEKGRADALCETMGRRIVFDDARLPQAQGNYYALIEQPEGACHRQQYTQQQYDRSDEDDYRLGSEKGEAGERNGTTLGKFGKMRIDTWHCHDSRGWRLHSVAVLSDQVELCLFYDNVLALLR